MCLESSEGLVVLKGVRKLHIRVLILRRTCRASSQRPQSVKVLRKLIDHSYPFSTRTHIVLILIVVLVRISQQGWVLRNLSLRSLTNYHVVLLQVCGCWLPTILSLTNLITLLITINVGLIILSHPRKQAFARRLVILVCKRSSHLWWRLISFGQSSTILLSQSLVRFARYFRTITLLLLSQ